MQRPIITVPPDLMRLTRVDWDIDWRGQSAAERTDGVTQVTLNAFPRWTGQPSIYLHDTAIVRWRAVRAAAQGRVGIYRLRMYDPIGFSDPLLGSDVPYSTGQRHSTGQGFEYVPICTAGLAAAAGATELRVTSSVAPTVGQIMSHADWPFMVTHFDTVSAGVYDLGVQMPLRAAIAAGDPINMQGTGLFEVVDTSQGNPAYDRSRIVRMSIGFQEVLVR